MIRPGLHWLTRRWVGAALLCGLACPAAAGDVASIVQEAAIRTLADITAMQVRCRDLDVQPGYAFRYLEEAGVSVVDVMPGGRRRPEFDADFDVVNLVDTPQLCSAMADQYALAVPGAITRRR